MNKQGIINQIKKHQKDIKRFGVSSLSLFGSAVRDEATDHSDVDLLVEFEEPVGLFDYFRLQHYLEDLLGVTRVDLIMPGAIKPALRDVILNEAVHVT